MASRPTKFVYQLTRVVMTVVMLLPTARLAAVESTTNQKNISVSQTKQPLFVDVELTAMNEVRGLVIDGQGQQLANANIQIASKHDAPTHTTTDEHGRFAISPLNTGEYRLSVFGSPVWCRCWKSGTAPPNARQDLLIVASKSVQRGQREFGSLIKSDKLLVALILAGAIAIPLTIISNSDNTAQPAS